MPIRCSPNAIKIWESFKFQLFWSHTECSSRNCDETHTDTHSTRIHIEYVRIVEYHVRTNMSLAMLLIIIIFNILCALCRWHSCCCRRCAGRTLADAIILSFAGETRLDRNGPYIYERIGTTESESPFIYEIKSSMCWTPWHLKMHDHLTHTRRVQQMLQFVRWHSHMYGKRSGKVPPICTHTTNERNERSVRVNDKKGNKRKIIMEMSLLLIADILAAHTHSHNTGHTCTKMGRHENDSQLLKKRSPAAKRRITMSHSYTLSVKIPKRVRCSHTATVGCWHTHTQSHAASVHVHSPNNCLQQSFDAEHNTKVYSVLIAWSIIPLNKFLYYSCCCCCCWGCHFCSGFMHAVCWTVVCVRVRSSVCLCVDMDAPL